MEITDGFVQQPEENISKKTTKECKVHKKRWFILLLYWVYTISSLMHWMEYSIKTNVIANYYSVSHPTVDFSSMIFLLLYIPFCIPGSYILDKLGLRVSVLIGATGISVGAWIKVLSVNPDRFWILMLGQFIIGIFQVFVIPVPPKLAAVWFGSKEVPLASSIAVAAIQMGIGTGFILPSLILADGTFKDIEKGLQNLSIVFAIPISLVIPVLYFFFDGAPSTPPSLAQLEIQEHEKEALDYKKCLKNLLNNKSFMLFVLIFGINVGMSYNLGWYILLNQIAQTYDSKGSKVVGIFGLIMTVISIAGCFLTGVFISKFGKLKEFTCGSILLTQMSLIIFFNVPSQDTIVWVYIWIVSFSFFVTCIFCAGLDLGVELTFPGPVGASIGFITISYQIFGVVFTYLYSFLYHNVSILSANLCMIFISLLTNCLLFFIKFELKRNVVNLSTFENSSPI